MSATLRMRLGPGPDGTTFPIDYFTTDAQGHVLPGELWGKNVEVLRMNLPRVFPIWSSQSKHKRAIPQGYHFRSLRSWMDSMSVI